MSPTPILDAIPIVRQAVYEALVPLNTATFWQQAKQGQALPYVIYQSQDAGGQAEKYIGSHGWSGLVTVKALAVSQKAAEDLYAVVAPGMNNLSSTGHDIATEFERPLVIPPDVAGVWQACGIWRVTIN